jgi:hypothetical protein
MWPNGAKLAFAIRDDDIGYFTSTEMIRRVHRLALSKGFPLSFAVIPEHRSSYDPNVPPNMRPLDSRFPVSQNKGLVDFLKEMLRSGRLEIMQHGLAHTEDRTEFVRSEFEGLTLDEAKARVRRGKEVLSRTFGCRISAFVAPQERLTRPLLRTLSEEGFACYCGSVGRSPPEHWLRLLARGDDLLRLRWRLREGGLKTRPVHLIPSLYLLSGYLHRSSRVGKDELEVVKQGILEARRRESYFIVATHSWDFYWEWGSIRPSMIDTYERILEFVDSLGGDVWRCRLSDVAPVATDKVIGVRRS